MADRYIIAADNAHLRIYRYSQEPGQFTPSLQPVDFFDFPETSPAYISREEDVSGRFPSSGDQSTREPFENSIPSREDVPRRSTEVLIERIAAFMQSNPNSTWDLAAGAAIKNELLEELPDGVRRRLNQVISKDLINVPPAEIREQFALR